MIERPFYFFTSRLILDLKMIELIYQLTKLSFCANEVSSTIADDF